MYCKIVTMVSKTFSEQRGGVRQKSLKAFKRAMRLCGSDLVGVLKHTRYVLKTQLPSTCANEEKVGKESCSKFQGQEDRHVVVPSW